MGLLVDLLAEGVTVEWIHLVDLVDLVGLVDSGGLSVSLLVNLSS